MRLQRVLKHALTHPFGIAVPVGKHRLYGSLCFGYQGFYLAIAEPIVSHRSNGGDHLETELEAIWASGDRVACQVDQVPHDLELRLKAFHGALCAHGPGVVDQVRHGACEGLVLIARQTELWLGAVGLINEQLILDFVERADALVPHSFLLASIRL